jgi:uncharacterized protein (TIGR02646 family)
MIRLPDVPLPAEALAELEQLQHGIDAIAEYADRVAAAKVRFKNRNTATDPLFQVVRDALAAMCQGPRRCGYCEDSAADEVEHVRPKDLYPEVVFAWTNYLYACGPCNGPKNNRFAVFSHSSAQCVDVTRKPRAPVIPPEPGDMVLIDPRTENPLDWMELDLLDTFHFVPTEPPGSTAYKRAQYTIDVLRLNTREYLVEARRAAYGNYFRLAADYVKTRDSGDAEAALADFNAGLRGMSHRTVWQEMQRQQQTIPRLRNLLGSAPELLLL